MQAAAPSGPSSATRPQKRILLIPPHHSRLQVYFVACELLAMVGASRYSYQSDFWTGTELCFVGRAAMDIVSRLGGSGLRKSEADDVASDALMWCAFLATYRNKCRVDTNVVESLERCRRKGKGMYEYDGSVRRQPVGKLAGPGVPQETFRFALLGKFQRGHSRRRKAKEITCVYLI